MRTEDELTRRVHEAIVGTAEIGNDYSDAITHRLLVALDALFEIAENRGVLDSVRVVGPNTPGPWSTPRTRLDDVSQQLFSRYRYDAQSKYRNLSEILAQIGNLLQLMPDLVTGTSTATPSAPNPTPSVPSPAPNSTPTTELPSGTVQGTVTWEAKTNGNNSSEWGFIKDLIQRQWNDGKIDTSSNPVPVGTAPEGSRGLYFELPAGMERLEVQPPVFQSMGRDAVLWLGFWFVADAVVEQNRDPWAIIAQLHGNDSTSPHQILAVDGGDLITGNGQSLKRFFNDRVKRNTRYNVVARFAADSRGSTSVWVNDERVLDNYAAGLNNLPLYLKMGLYRQPSGSPNQKLWVGGHKIGTGYGAVRPR